MSKDVLTCHGGDHTKYSILLFICYVLTVLHCIAYIQDRWGLKLPNQTSIWLLSVLAFGMPTRSTRRINGHDRSKWSMCKRSVWTSEQSGWNMFDQLDSRSNTRPRFKDRRKFRRNFRQYGLMEKHSSQEEAQAWRKSEEGRRSDMEKIRKGETGARKGRTVVMQRVFSHVLWLRRVEK